MINSEILIKKVKVEDVHFIAKIGAATFHETFAEYNTKEDMNNYLEEKFNIRQITSEIKDDKNKFLLAMHNKKPIGYAKMRTSKNPDELKNKRTIEIERIYVLKAYHDKKAGAALMSQCLDFAKQQNFEFIWLGVWEHNPKATKFYEKWGFEKFGSHVFKIGNDAQTDLLMKKML